MVRKNADEISRKLSSVRGRLENVELLITSIERVLQDKPANRDEVEAILKLLRGRVARISDLVSKLEVASK